jgi:hypothetical protein
VIRLIWMFCLAYSWFRIATQMTRIGADFFATNFHEFSRIMDIEDWSGFYKTLVAA